METLTFTEASLHKLRIIEAIANACNPQMIVVRTTLHPQTSSTEAMRRMRARVKEQEIKIKKEKQEASSTPASWDSNV